MTESEWDTCTDPRSMFQYLRRKASDRKLRLFCVACCRSVWDWLVDPQSRAAVEVSEQYADGLMSKDDLFKARNAAKDAVRNSVGPSAQATSQAAGAFPPAARSLPSALSPNY